MRAAPGRDRDTKQGAQSGTRFGGVAAVIEPQHLAQASAAVSPPTTLRWPSERCEISRQNPRSCKGMRSVGVGAVRHVRPVTAAAPSTSRSTGRPPPNGSAAGRSRFATQCVDRQDTAALPSGSNPASCGNRKTSCAAHAARGLAAGGSVEPAYRAVGSLTGVAARQAVGTVPRRGTHRPAGFRARVRRTRSRGLPDGAHQARCDTRSACDPPGSARNAARRD